MRNAMRNALRVLSVSLVLLFVAHIAVAEQGGGRCSTVGGLIMTNLGAIDANTTLGIATGDLSGGVSATILSITGPQNALTFLVQHHWVTESGDAILFAQMQAFALEVLSTPVYGVTFQPLRITGGTGRYQGASGVLSVFGSADLGSGRTAFRYTGKVCLDEQASQD
jgi:hypothetical protein